MAEAAFRRPGNWLRALSLDTGETCWVDAGQEGAWFRDGGKFGQLGKGLKKRQILSVILRSLSHVASNE